jgi:CTD kinase subunit beta
MNVLQLEFGLSLDAPDDKKIIYTAWEIGMDLNLTFALLKQSAVTMAIACAELAMRLRGRSSDVEALFPTSTNPMEKEGATDADAPYTRFATTRSAVLETEMDVLDLYTTHRSSTFAGAKFSLEEIMQVRIALNQIAERFALPRHVNPGPSTTNGDALALQLQPAQYIRDLKLEPEQASDGAAGTDGAAAEEKDSALQIIAVKRFVLKPAHAVQEVQSLDRYYLTREEEYEREHEVSDGWETAPENGGDGDGKLESAGSGGRGRAAEGNGGGRREEVSGSSFRRKKR